MTKELKKDAVDQSTNLKYNDQSVDWKKEHNQKKFYDPITFKGIKIGYTGDLLDDKNIPF